MELIATFVLGVLLGACIPESYKLQVSRVGAAARDAVVGHAPAPATPARPSVPLHVTVSNVLGFFWKWRTPILLIALALLAIGLMRGCSFRPFGETAADVRAKIAEGEIETQKTINKRDAAMAELARELDAIRREIRYNAEQGRNEIEAAIPDHEEPIDPTLVAAWRSSLDRLCVVRADGSRADTCGPGA